MSFYSLLYPLYAFFIPLYILYTLIHLYTLYPSIPRYSPFCYLLYPAILPIRLDSLLYPPYLSTPLSPSIP